MHEEFALGGSGAAAPLSDAQGRVVAALNVATVTARFDAKRETLLRELLATAQLISQRLGSPAGAAAHPAPESPHARR